MTDFESINQRVSRRFFIKKSIDKITGLWLSEYVKEINKISNLSIEIDMGNPSMFKENSYNYGRFKGVENALIMKGDNSLPYFNQRLGYYGQKILLELVKRGFGTCWVGLGAKIKGAESLKPSEKIRGIIVFGYVQEITEEEQFIYASTKMVQRRLESIYKYDKSLPSENIISGIKAVQKAPSSLNRQPVEIICENNIITAKVPKPQTLQGIDLGIAMLHFEIGSGIVIKPFK